MNRFLLIILLLFTLFSCKKEQKLPDNILLRFDDKYLAYEEVVDMIPGGLHPADSASLFASIVESWIEDVVLSDFAEHRLYDTSVIDQKVKEYKKALIVQEYLTRMRDANSPKIDEKKVKEYYDLHRKELKLEVPLVKGIFLKINSDAKGKEDIKRLLSSDKTENIDKLENEWLDRAVQYNYFPDKWIDWTTVSGLIPYRFGDPEYFLDDNYYFETQDEDSKYYLKITDYLPSGSEQPYEFARSWIIDILTQGALADYERNLVTSLVNNSIKDNRLEIIGYDSIKHEIKTKFR